MDFQVLGPIGTLLAGLAGVAAVVKVLIDHHKTKKQNKLSAHIAAEDVELRREVDVPGTYGELLERQRNFYESALQTTNRRVASLEGQVSAQAAHQIELDKRLAERDSKIVALTIDRDTLIQHIVEGRGLPLPELRTI